MFCIWNQLLTFIKATMPLRCDYSDYDWGTAKPWFWGKRWGNIKQARTDLLNRLE
jgi:hypothetical protein